MEEIKNLLDHLRITVRTETGRIPLEKRNGYWSSPGAYAEITMKEHGGATAVFVSVQLEKGSFDPEDGLRIGLALPTGRRMMADRQHSEYWCRPEFPEDPSAVPEQTQALLWEREDGSFGYLLPVCGEQYKAVLGGGEDGLTLRMASWCAGLKECRGLAFVIAEGNDPWALAQQCADAGLSLLPGNCPSREGRRYPELFEYLGWCSWDALQIRVSEEGLAEKCAEFQEKGIPVRWIIIDDMWGDVKGLYDIEHPSYKAVLDSRHSTMLNSFEGDPYRFPEGLGHCVRRLKEEFGVRVGIWHPTSGYWSGIDPEGELARDFGGDLMEGANGRLVPDFHFPKAFDFYFAYHRFLEECGVDFLKIDNQSTLRRYYHGFAPVGEVAGQVHRAMEASVGICFDGRLINCMGMANENMWHRPASAISRASDDFLPENRPWFAKHILQCSYNSLVQGSFLWCDWDMWWTDDSQGVKNSVLRAVSGGPIYVSDTIGRSRKEVLEPLILSDGRILRCDCPAVPARDCLTQNPEQSQAPFKVFSRCGQGAAAAAFHLHTGDGAAEGSIGLADFGLDEGKSYAVFERFTGETAFLSGRERLPLQLENADDFRLYLLVPVENGFAPFGLKEKFIAPKTISGTAGRTVALREGGTFLFASTQPVKQVLSNGLDVPFRKNGDFYEAEIPSSGRAAVSIMI